MYEDWQKLIIERRGIDDYADWLVDEVWERGVALLASDVDEAVAMIDHEFSGDDLAWLSEAMEEVIEATRSRALLDAMYRAVERFPAESETYSIRSYVEDAERLLDYLESKADASGGGTGRGERDDSVQRRKAP